MFHAVKASERMARASRSTAYIRVAAAVAATWVAAALGAGAAMTIVVAVGSLGWAIVATVNEWGHRLQTIALFTSDRVLELRDGESDPFA